jgi:predicted nucleic acid-binding protein
MQGVKTFVDTAVLVYAYDVSAGAKHETAVPIMRDLWISGNGVISMQVLQEFFITVTGKIAHPLDVTTARETVKDFLKWSPVPVNGGLLVDAIDIHAAHRFSFRDSLIIAAAIESGAGALLSEDLADQRTSITHLVSCWLRGLYILTL